MQRVILIGLAGLAGTLARYWLGGLAARRLGESFPFGTLAVNVVGCFLAGLFACLIQERYADDETARAVVLVGLLGGFTTFSAFGLQTFALLRDGRPGLAAVNLLCSNALGLLMVWAGYSLAKSL